MENLNENKFSYTNLNNNIYFVDDRLLENPPPRQVHCTLADLAQTALDIHQQKVTSSFTGPPSVTAVRIALFQSGLGDLNEDVDLEGLYRFLVPYFIRGDHDTVRLAIDQYGRDPFPLLIKAYLDGHNDLVSLLLRFPDKVDVNAQHAPTRRTALSVAIDSQDEPFIHKLLAAGAHVQTTSGPVMTPLTLATYSLDVESSAYQWLKQFDGGFTQELTYRVFLAHYYGIREQNGVGGQTQINTHDGRVITRRLAGMTPYDLAPVWKQLIHEFYLPFIQSSTPWGSLRVAVAEQLKGGTLGPVSALLGFLTDADGDKVLKGVYHTLVNCHFPSAVEIPNQARELAERVQREPVALVSSLPSHMAGILLTSSEIYRCNKGMYHEGISGVRVSKIGKPANIESVLNKLLLTTPEFLNKGVEEELGLQFLDLCSQKFQKIGNCAVASANALELAVLWQAFSTVVNPQVAKLLATLLQKTRTSHSRLSLLSRYLTLHQDPSREAFPPDDGLLELIYLKNRRVKVPSECDRRQDMILKWKERRASTQSL